MNTPSRCRAVALLAILAGVVTAAPPLVQHTDAIFHVTYHPDGRSFATVGKDPVARIWGADGKERLALKTAGKSLYGAAFSPDGRILAVAGADGVVTLWDTSAGRKLRELLGHNEAAYLVAFSPDGRRLATGGSDETVRLWDSATGAALHVLRGHTDRVVTVAFSPDGRTVASASPDSKSNTAVGGEVKLWDAETGAAVRNLPIPGAVTAVFSPDGGRLAVARTGGQVEVWEVLLAKRCLLLTGHTLEAYHVAFRPDGRLLASCSGSWSADRAGEVHVWDLSTGKSIQKFTGFDTPVWTVAFRPDGGQLVAATGKWDKRSSGTVLAWDASGFLPAVSPEPAERALTEAWADLAGEDPEKAYRAVWRLRMFPAQAVPFLRERLIPLPGIDARRVEALIARLDDNRYAAREEAYQELKGLGKAVVAALRRARQTPASAEARRRLDSLLEAAANPTYSRDELRALRAIEVLRGVATPEVRPALEKLAQSAATTAGQEAVAALEWLTKKGIK